eukprot:4192303-Lingulodinium_polyedra.AAC.1
MDILEDIWARAEGQWPLDLQQHVRAGTDDTALDKVPKGLEGQSADPSLVAAALHQKGARSDSSMRG